MILPYLTDTSNLALTILKGPAEALLGVVYGIVIGVALWYLPEPNSVCTPNMKVTFTEHVLA